MHIYPDSREKNLFLLFAALLFFSSARAQNNGEDLFKKGMDELDRGQYNSAKLDFSTAIANSTKKCSFYLFRGVAEMAMKDSNAGPDLEYGYMNCDSHSIRKCHFYLAEIYYKQGAYEKSFLEYSKSLDAWPNFYNNKRKVYLGMALCKEKEANYKAADSLFSLIIKNSDPAAYNSKERIIALKEQGLILSKYLGDKKRGDHQVMLARMLERESRLDAFKKGDAKGYVGIFPKAGIGFGNPFSIQAGAIAAFAGSDNFDSYTGIYGPAFTGQLMIATRDLIKGLNFSYEYNNTILGGKIGVAPYFSNKSATPDVRLNAEIGLTLFGNISLYIGGSYSMTPKSSIQEINTFTISLYINFLPFNVIGGKIGG